MVDIATQAGRLIRDQFRRPVASYAKPDGTFATAVDIAINQALMDWSMRYRVDFIGEEGCRTLEGYEHILYVDPLDGTHGYQRGLSGSTIVMSLMERRDSFWYPIIAVIHEPLTGWTWSAAEDIRSVQVSLQDIIQELTSVGEMDGPPCHVSIATWPGVPYHLDRALDMVKASTTMRHQSLTGIALGGGLIASGLLHGTVFAGKSAVETAAMSLIVRKAGGVTLDFAGHLLSGFKLACDSGDKVDLHLPHGAIVACNRFVAAELQKTIQAAQPRA